jgi:colanic acid biosynthesis glycosyl transferase WcaI
MRIVVWGINYWPEAIGIAPFNRGMCRFLAAQGHEVSMVSSFAYYPAWRKTDGDKHRIFRTDLIEQIPVYRCWHYVPARATAVRRILHEFSFGITSFLRILSLPRADLYVVVSPPLLLGPLAWLACFIKRSRYVFHVQDLQPDAALVLGMIKEKGVLSQVLSRMAALTYRHATLVSGISQAMINAFAEKGVPVRKRYLFANWIAIEETPSKSERSQKPGPATWQRQTGILQGGGAQRPASQVTALVESTGCEVEPLLAKNEAGYTEASLWRARYKIPHDAFVASYSGNLGRKQGLEVLIDAAELLGSAHNPESRLIIILIVGDGAMRPVLESRLRNNPLLNARLLPLLPDADYRGMMAASDVCLITQAKGTGRFCMPSKLLSILVAAKPVIAAADESSELVQSVRCGDFGIVVPPENPLAIASALTEIAVRPAELARLGQQGSRWGKRFEARFVLGQFERRLQEISCYRS